MHGNDRRQADALVADDAPYGEAISRRLESLAGITDEPGQITRLYLSEAHRRAVPLVTGWMEDAGMDTHLDAAASVIGRYPGRTPDAPTLIIGSHIDTVRNAGRFDGTLGVLTGIEVVRRLHLAGRRLPFAIEVAAFGDEEGVRFPNALTSSRALAGRFVPSTLDEKDRDGLVRRDCLKAFGCDPDAIGSLARDPARTLGYVELHIEQGPVLEECNLPLGIVTGIQGCSRGWITFTGLASHAGTTPMHLRKDALATASEFVLAAEGEARASNGMVVATVGELQIPNGAVNTVPQTVRLSLDVRSPDDALRHAALERIVAQARALGAARQVGVEASITYDAAACPSDPHLMDLFRATLSGMGLEPFALPSGAGHDAMSFHGVLPFVMLFLRCRAGLSHHPDEYASPADIGLGAEALAGFIERLAAEMA